MPLLKADLRAACSSVDYVRAFERKSLSRRHACRTTEGDKCHHTPSGSADSQQHRSDAITGEGCLPTRPRYGTPPKNIRSHPTATKADETAKKRCRHIRVGIVADGRPRRDCQSGHTTAPRVHEHNAVSPSGKMPMPAGRYTCQHYTSHAYSISVRFARSGHVANIGSMPEYQRHVCLSVIVFSHGCRTSPPYDMPVCSCAYGFFHRWPGCHTTVARD